jgi:uncharacterized membrane protein YjdF
MEICLERDEAGKKVLTVVRIIYVITGIVLTVLGFIHHSSYEIITSAGTVILLPGLYLLRRIFKCRGGWLLEAYLYIYTYLSWMLGGAAQLYTYLPHYDKFVHCVSGFFVSAVALTLYRMLERRHSRDGENPATESIFVFSASMAVAGLFELCEYALAPIMHRDFQHVLDSGVTDTMMDMFVCLIGTLISMILIIRSHKGKHNFITDAADAFVLQNPAADKKSGD